MGLTDSGLKEIPSIVVKYKLERLEAISEISVY